MLLNDACQSITTWKVSRDQPKEPIEVEYFFLFAPNNSGTTVMSQYIATQLDAYLPPFGNNEGLMMPQLRLPQDNMLWDLDRTWDWPAIKALWDPLPTAAGKDLFVEASPSNMLHVTAIRETFGHHHAALFSMASPYAFIASFVANYRRAPLTAQVLDRIVQRWQLRADFMCRNRLEHADIPFLSYETFCTDPTEINRLFDIPLRAEIEIAGKKNSGLRRIEDQTPRHVAFLTEGEWHHVNTRLSENPDLLETHGYKVQSGSDLRAMARRTAPGLFEKGQAKRDRWNRQDVPRRRLDRLPLPDSLRRLARKFRP